MELAKQFVVFLGMGCCGNARCWPRQSTALELPRKVLQWVRYFNYDFLNELQLDESGSLNEIFIMCCLCHVFWEQIGQTTALAC